VNKSRQASGVSKITHRGYLLKRSNHPYIERFNGDAIGEADNFPELPLMPGMFSPGNLEDSSINHTCTSLETKETLPLHTALVAPSSPEKSVDVNASKNPIQQGLDAAVTFFGLTLGDKHQEAEVYEDSMEEQSHPSGPKVTPQKQKASKPIKVSNRALLEKKGARTDSFQEALHRRHSVPMTLTPDPNENSETTFLSSSPPNDFIDPKDGHVWRAKYCVLDGGILYFYRNVTDGESSDAITERSEDSSTQSTSAGNRSKSKSSISDLSKSPMTRHFFHHIDSSDSRDSASCMWEKRVVLDCVSAVRSAEREYGPHSFELQGIGDDDESSPVDTLVLRAHDHSSMTEWIFQFHRSLASFVRDIVGVFGSTGAYLDIDFPRTARPQVPETPSTDSEEKFQQLLSRSPRMTNASLAVNSLSHGHGRITVHRRREDVGRLKASNNAGSYSLSPTAGTGGSTFAGLARSIDTSPTVKTFRMLPGHGPQDRFLLPPAGQTVHETSKIAGVSASSLKSNSTNETFRKYVPPSLRMRQAAENVSSSTFSQNDPVNSSKRYVPPSLRNLSSQGQRDAPRSLEEREVAEQEKQSSGFISTPDPSAAPSELDLLNSVEDSDVSFQRGGCADPKLVSGSIMDLANIPRGASKLPKSRSEAFGSFGGEVKLSWETGAVSECGIRDSNEDAYLIIHDLREASRSATEKDMSRAEDNTFRDIMGLFAIFDGHCGNQAARYAAEKIVFFLQEELQMHNMNAEGAPVERQSSVLYRERIETALHAALKKLDDEFCNICQEGGRDWESGTTAIVAMIVDRWLLIANLGDCRGVVCRSVNEDSSFAGGGWNELDSSSGVSSGVEGGAEKRRCFWQEVANVHKPSDENEQARIQRANGWVTTETEIPIGQLRRMDFLDEDVVGILRRCFSDRYENSGSTIRECKSAPQRILQISRVCGELAVSRALGDRDFKAAFHTKSGPTLEDEGQDALWDCPLLLAYPEQHSRVFHGDLVDNSPDFQQIQIGEEGCSEEFVLLASDGLWVSAFRLCQRGFMSMRSFL
jgi:serine/threonine protein phosphatase PrpC